MTRRQYRNPPIEENPLRPLGHLGLPVPIGELGKRKAIELLIPMLADAPSRQINAVFDAITATDAPQEFWNSLPLSSTEPVASGFFPLPYRFSNNRARLRGRYCDSLPNQCVPNASCL